MPKRNNLNSRFYDALINQKIEEIRKCVEEGFDLNQVVPKLNITSFEFGLQLGFFPILKLLLELGFQPNFQEVNSALMLSASFGDPDFTKTFLELDADVNYFLLGYTPLIATIDKSFNPYDLQVSRILIESGAKLEIQGKYSNTALTTAIYKKKKKIIDLLLSKGASEEQSSSAYLLQESDNLNLNLKKIDRLLKKGANVNFQNSGGYSPIHFASSFGLSSLVQLLISANANLNIQSENGFVPLMIAINHRNLDVIKMLIFSGADINYIVNEYQHNITDYTYYTLIDSEIKCQILRVLKECQAPDPSLPKYRKMWLKV
jgi:ankyrin repeat protein